MHEETTFKWSVWGISLKGAFATRFGDNSSIAPPYADAANAGFIIASQKTVNLYSTKGTILPEINTVTDEGGANFNTYPTKPEKLPITSVAP